MESVEGASKQHTELPGSKEEFWTTFRSHSFGGVFFPPVRSGSFLSESFSFQNSQSLEIMGDMQGTEAFCHYSWNSPEAQKSGLLNFIYLGEKTGKILEDRKIPRKNTEIMEKKLSDNWPLSYVVLFVHCLSSFCFYFLVWLVLCFRTRGTMALHLLLRPVSCHEWVLFSFFCLSILFLCPTVCDYQVHN